jgi:hypothetical protein
MGREGNYIKVYDINNETSGPAFIELIEITE